MATYRLRMLTPRGAVFDGDVTAMVAPGEAGYLGVLANHAPLISTLLPGKLRITDASGSDKWYHVTGGILRVARNDAVLLSESIEETTAAS